MGTFFSSLRSIHHWGNRVTCRGIKWYISYFFMIFQKRNSRMFKYDLTADGQPFKAGLFIPSEEWDLECPSERQEKDETFFFGINSAGECLALQIARECAYDSSSSLLLKMNECTYTLPIKFNYLATENKRMLGSNRFSVECLAPFRKWKIFFNGMLRETCQEKDHEDHNSIIHVRFSFIWVASSGVFDFLSDYSSSNMADILSEIKWNSLKPPINKILSYLNEYHQPGMLHGTVQIGNKIKQDVTLWGCRRHAFGGREDYFGSHLDLFGNTESGFFFYFKIMSVDNSVTARNVSGYIMKPNGSLKAVRFMSAKRIVTETKNILKFRIKAGGFYYNISVFFHGYGELFGKGIGENMAFSIVDVLVNGVWGGGIVIERMCAKRIKNHKKCQQASTSLESEPGVLLDPVVVTLGDPQCLNKTLAGNLGSALAKLMQSKDKITGYDIPLGFVVTTSGYEEYLTPVQQSVGILKENFSKYRMDEMIPLCRRIVEEVSNSYFPPVLYDSLSTKLNMILKDADEATFNIYPSVAGTDNAVQLLEAYLDMYFNIVGFSEIISCIKKCWASQYSFKAIQCKSSSGQLLNMPMAVIVQKTVPFDTSGVITACESSSGNPSILEIREEINKISSGAIRITRLKRDLKQRVTILDTNIIYEGDTDRDSDSDNGDDDIGAESKKITVQFLGKNSLTEKQILDLGRLACKLEASFLLPLGIEWCLNKKKLYILQVRPIMFIQPKSEIFHYYDTYLRSEDEWISSFAAGEAFLGPISPLGMNIINFFIEVFVANMMCIVPDLWRPYYPKFVIYSHYYMLYCVADGFWFLFFSDQDCFQSLLYVMNFRLLDSQEELLQFISYRHGCNSLSLKMILKNIIVLFFCCHKPEKWDEKFDKYNFNLENMNSSSDVLDAISKNYQDLTKPFICFMKCTYKAVFWNMFVFYVLGKMIQDENNVPKDFNFLMSACSISEKGDIAVDILGLSNRIAMSIGSDIFKKMPIEDAKIWLEDNEIDQDVQFSAFLKKHGHRSYREIDIFQKCLSMDPVSLIRALQIISPYTSSNFVPTSYSLDHVFHQLSVMPNYFQKLILKYAIPKCITAVRQAKMAKSNLLKVASFWRQAFQHLANNAVKEFRLPFPESLFFLSLEDINQLLKTESPHLVTKALKCWEIFGNLDKCLFPVIAIGYPVPLNENFYATRRLNVGSCLKGCPMSTGTVVGTATVITDFNKIENIEKGCILITRSPSIIWSLYFPILGGFATDLGGVLSDGAVAAREYGLPCVINLVRASQVLKSGDRVFLDGNVGTLRRMSPD